MVGLRAAKLFKKDVRLGCMGLRGKRPLSVDETRVGPPHRHFPMFSSTVDVTACYVIDKNACSQ